ncbi:MAG: XRE family transcriptional regulator [Chloroflexota bacterium]|nr:XRE family transcriptional regulator [Chloroflexota bacterium]
MVEAFITGTMLRWARERSYPSIDAAAEKLKVKVETLAAWEGEEARPTFLQAQGLAKRLHISFGYLYLSTPPDETLPLPDLRTKPGAEPQRPSPDFVEVLYDALRKRDWYHDYLVGEEADPLPFVGRFRPDSPINEVASDIRRTLALDDPQWHQPQRLDDYFRQVVPRVEQAGVLVMRRSVVGNNTRRRLNPDEFQGFAVSDSLAPLVFINENDYQSAQVFTLAHELAHIWMGLSGVTGLDFRRRPSEQTHLYERVTDAVAAETLVPSATFELRWNNTANIDQNLEELSLRYHVSKFVVLRRAYGLNKVDAQQFHAKREELRMNIRTARKTGGGSTYRAIFARNGNTLTSTLLYSVLAGRVPPTEAAALLNVRPAKLRGLEKFLLHRACPINPLPGW